MFIIFKEFKALMEKQSRWSLKVLRTDSGGEYTSNEFERFRKGHEVVHEVVAPYTPQHNEVVERRNQIVVNMIKSMLKQKGLPYKFWGEAAMTTSMCSINIQPRSLKENFSRRY